MRGGKTKSLTPEELLFREGWGTRRECRELLRRGRVRFPEGVGPWEGTRYLVDGVEYRAHSRILIALHKPQGYECSVRPTHHPSVLDLLPERFLRRGVQPIGRLDADTTGLLLLTDDGQLNHRLSHPRQHVPKTYLLETETAWQPFEVAHLVTGVELRRDGRICAQSARLLQPHLVEVVIEQGLYHQVRRMAAALGKRCRRLIRTGFGPWTLEGLSLEEGQWCVLALTDWETGDRIPLD